MKTDLASKLKHKLLVRKAVKLEAERTGAMKDEMLAPIRRVRRARPALPKDKKIMPIPHEEHPESIEYNLKRKLKPKARVA